MVLKQAASGERFVGTHSAALLSAAVRGHDRLAVRGAARGGCPAAQLIYKVQLVPLHQASSRQMDWKWPPLLHLCHLSTSPSKSTSAKNVSFFFFSCPATP